MTNRELALEAAVRFTDRNKFAIDTMLKNAEKIEAWLSQRENIINAAPEEFFNAEEGKLLDNPLREITTGYHNYVKIYGKVPTKAFCHGSVVKALNQQMGKADCKSSFEMYALSVSEDNSLSQNTIRFAL